MTAKERANLKSLASQMEPVIHIGKGGITDSVIASAETALKARELVKGSVLESSMLTSREACGILADALGAEPVQAIGNRFVLYRKKPAEKPKAVKKPVARSTDRKATAAGNADRKTASDRTKAVKRPVVRPTGGKARASRSIGRKGTSAGSRNGRKPEAKRS